MAIHLPLELVCKILEFLPDINSLQTAILVHPWFYTAFSCYRKSITTSVLRNELPHEIYIHATTNFICFNGNYSIPDLESIADFSDITLHLDRLRYHRNSAGTLTVSLREALFISRTEKKVVELCKLVLGDCSYGERQNLFPLWNAVYFPKPSPSERIRVHQAIYLFNILSSLCQNLRATSHYNARHLDRFRNEFQKCIVEQLMAPWEFFQVIGIRAYFRRAFYGIAYDQVVDDQSLSCILVSGLDVIHHALCVMGPSRLDEVIELRAIPALSDRAFAFDAILSQALSNSWSQQWRKSFRRHQPFWQDDERSFQSWRKFEDRQIEVLGGNPQLSELIQHESALLGGYFGLWGATLWDENRWEDVLYNLVRPGPIGLVDIPEDWDLMAIGVLLIEEALLLQEH